MLVSTVRFGILGILHAIQELVDRIDLDVGNRGLGLAMQVKHLPVEAVPIGDIGVAPAKRPVVCDY